MTLKTTFHLFIYFIFSINALAQNANYAIINSLEIVGNKKTKEKIILRELDLLPADTIYINQIQSRFLENEKRVLNTGLFTNIEINIKNWNTERKELDLVVNLVENWYIYPAPIFELADRNFNVWWTEQDRSLSRVNYGLRASHINLTGNRDKLKFTTQFGYTRKYEAQYDFPYLNNKQTIGIAGNIFYSENKEIGYETQNNKTLFHQEEDERILLKRFRVGGWMDYRMGLYSFHRLKLEFHRNSIADVIAQEINPDYFLNGDTRLKFFKLEYNFDYDRRIFNLYPLGGYSIGANIQKEGLGLFDEFNNLSISVEGQKFFSFNRKFVIGMRLKGKTNVTNQIQAFANNTGLGYGRDVVSGYDLYVIDGTDYVLSQNVFRLKIIDKFFNLSNYMPVPAFKLMNFKMFLSFNFDWAYVNEPTYQDTNTLNNKIIYGYGPGLDFILFNNYLFQIEYGINQLGEKTLFLHNAISF